MSLFLLIIIYKLLIDVREVKTRFKLIKHIDTGKKCIICSAIVTALLQWSRQLHLWFGGADSEFGEKENKSLHDSFRMCSVTCCGGGVVSLTFSLQSGGGPRNATIPKLSSWPHEKILTVPHVRQQLTTRLAEIGLNET
jgi:hypothetical protein